ncbi:MAG: hypothetical protein PHC28_08895 [Flavobacterium sp.]|uniref:DUF6660 family protein n=1 Tax=Flavobacterium sp. TaxID=239 RepID=UPI00261FDF9A|nr:DUF6660 family protein [Flavobacterium sp.]MDD5150585.1 hypothetical protein [Flavobacterium sp.]
MLNFILSIIILILSFMPCADMEQDVSCNKVTISNESNHTHNKDACTPLCICNCCGCQGFAYNTIYPYNLFAVKIIIDKKVPEYKSILTSNFFGSIWQPPQINA